MGWLQRLLGLELKQDGRQRRRSGWDVLIESRSPDLDIDWATNDAPSVSTHGPAVSSNNHHHHPAAHSTTQPNFDSGSHHHGGHDAGSFSGHVGGFDGGGGHGHH